MLALRHPRVIIAGCLFRRNATTNELKTANLDRPAAGIELSAYADGRQRAAEIFQIIEFDPTIRRTGPATVQRMVN